MKHTKAPWRIFDTVNSLGIGTTEGIGICEVYRGDGGTEELKEAEANAKLIAAAPELLEALRSAQAYLYAEGRTDNESKNMYKIIFDAIKKATE